MKGLIEGQQRQTTMTSNFLVCLFLNDLYSFRFGFRIAEPNGGKRRTQRKVQVDLLTTRTPPRAAGSPWTRRRSPGESWTGWRRRSANRSAGCSSPRTSLLLGIYSTPPDQTVTAGCHMLPTATTTLAHPMILWGDTRRTATNHLTLCRPKTTTKDTSTGTLGGPSWTWSTRATGPCAPATAERPACRNSTLSASRASSRTPDRDAPPRPYRPPGL